MSQPLSRVLCVDDNELIGEAVELMLREQDDLEWAGWLADACEIEQETVVRRPDVILLDMNMPGRDSFEVLGSMRAKHSGVRVLIFSGYFSQDCLDRAIDAGAMGYVSKNDDPGDVLEALRRAIRWEIAISPGAASQWALPVATAVSGVRKSEGR